MSLLPSLEPTKLVRIRPTQMTVGLAEVEAKTREWRAAPEEARNAYLVHHAFPAMRGPEGRVFIVDHHHLGRALIEEKVEAGYVAVLTDLSGLDPDEFWGVMDHHRWVNPYDADGRRHPFEDIPKKLTRLANDPYRSLAAEVRREGGYAKETAPYAEFLWADFFPASN